MKKLSNHFSQDDRATVLLKSCSRNCAHCAIDKLNLLSRTPSAVTDLGLASFCRLTFSKPAANKVLEMTRGNGKSFPFIAVRTFINKKTLTIDKLSHFSHLLQSILITRRQQSSISEMLNTKRMTFLAQSRYGQRILRYELHAFLARDTSCFAIRVEQIRRSFKNVLRNEIVGFGVVIGKRLDQLRMRNCPISYRCARGNSALVTKMKNKKALIQLSINCVSALSYDLDRSLVSKAKFTALRRFSLLKLAINLLI